ncbi:HD domain protein [Bordetella bronchiseptica CA90 BB1334]|nr:HD domain protein [Bordetella bronchiseptica CA90 BB1334]
MARPARRIAPPSTTGGRAWPPLPRPPARTTPRMTWATCGGCGTRRAPCCRRIPRPTALVVLAASYLHDLVNLPKNHPERHLASRQAAAAARERLARAGFPAARLDAVAHAIEAHSFSAGIAPRTIEARIVQDADRLDALGPVGLARMFHVGGSLGRALAHPSDPLAAQRALDDSRYTLDHIEAKLARLPHGMQTEAGRRLGEQRLAWLRDFRAAFAAQWGGGQLR